ncbi:type I-E CRISPR-associated protein Cas7/Cse4/CasC [Brachybacterium hainanense]|uniref:Type I-E CRISPR-associated protein Cas7/Cse4/CasC n=1 Tax=Brachybacterium hainanense TaxID=1541174 RepID=A0ABV6R900_9MICO
MFIDIHTLQYIPLSCINRDDAGMPKTVTISGVRRARWSTYSQKRLLRMRLRELLPKGSTSIRTRRLPALVAEELKQLGASETVAAAAIESLLTHFKQPAKSERSDGLSTAVMVTMPDGTPRSLARAAIETGGKLDKATIKEKLEEAVPLDVAMSGRFIAEVDTRTDGALSVAHAVGTGPDGYVSEFWTSVDDLAGEQGHGGSGGMGSQGLTSGVLYRYASIDLRELDSRMDAAGTSPTSREELLRLTISEFARLRPEAMKRSSAPFTEPSLVQLDVSEAPRCLVDAFSEPVLGQDVIADSITRLIEHADTMNRLYGGPALTRRVSTQDPESIPFATALEDTLAHVAGEGSR